MRRFITASIAMFLAGTAPTMAEPRAEFSNPAACEANKLVGYGVVVGLDGTGDAFESAPFTRQALEAYLKRVPAPLINASVFDGKVAAVMVEARLRFCSHDRKGSHLSGPLDLRLTAIGEAKKLDGGALLITPLLGADGHTYAVGQGVVAACPTHTVVPNGCIAAGGLVPH